MDDIYTVCAGCGCGLRNARKGKLGIPSRQTWVVQLCDMCVAELIEKAVEHHKPPECSICGRLFRTKGALGIHLMWCKCKHCAHWVPGTISYRRCLAGKGAYVHDEGSSPPPNNCSDYRRK